jgi:outer membrane lipoprotein-sorting protein
VTVHEDVLQAVSTGMDQRLDPDRAFIVSCHLAECADCLATAGAFARVDALARAQLAPAGPAPFEGALAAAIATPEATPVAGSGARRPQAAGRPGRRRPRVARRVLLSAAALVLALAVVVGVAVVIPSTGPGPLPQRVAAAEVLARAERAAAGLSSLQGTFTRTGKELADESTGTYRFVYQQPDRLRVEGRGTALFRLRIYDGLRARRVWWLRGDDAPTVAAGLPLARPQGQDALDPLGEAFAWYGARLTDPGAHADATTRGGDTRQVYVLTLRRERTYEEITGPLGFTHYEVWVDAQTYLPVRIRHRDRREPGAPIVEETRFTYDKINQPVKAGAFDVPKGARAIDGGAFTPMPLDRARAMAGDAAPVVRALPGPGWKLLRSGYASVGQITGAEGANPPGRDLVVAVYGLGLARLTVTSLLVTPADLRIEGGGSRPYEDPFGAEGARRRSRAVRLGGGAFRGTGARLGLPPDRPPYLWFRAGDGVVVTLTGTVTEADLVAAAASMTR